MALGGSSVAHPGRAPRPRWLAHDPRPQRPVAIKLLPPVQDQDVSVLDHRLREARHGAPSHTRHIVPVFEVDDAGACSPISCPSMCPAPRWPSTCCKRGTLRPARRRRGP